MQQRRLAGRGLARQRGARGLQQRKVPSTVACATFSHVLGPLTHKATDLLPVPRALPLAPLPQAGAAFCGLSWAQVQARHAGEIMVEDYCFRWGGGGLRARPMEPAQ